ncbi:MAG: 30S ribosomal protein S5 [Candidatus Methanofastidiosa archaeon]|nr:30S ribosomal protein S5 [Candidatus Methanofastidiosa archaeon]MDD4280631.1 30S ribosomal protein S5 [Candidatus Methanofastidiosa archaeon]
MRRDDRTRKDQERVDDSWVPKTELGKAVKEGKFKDIGEIFNRALPILETEIVDYLLPELSERDFQEVLSVNMVQRMTDSGRRVKFACIVVVGNKDGYVGLGYGKAQEVGPAIRKAITNGKLNLIQIKRGCGSWECGCGTPHTIPFQVEGKSSSVSVTLLPAPRGLGVATGDIGKKILHLAGIKDVWSRSFGKTQTTLNLARAIFEALKKTNEMSVQQRHIDRIGIVSGRAQQ